MARETEPARLVKTLLPAKIVREMDAAILRSAGAYQDRNEFIAEAIRDRLLEDRAGAQDEVTAPVRPVRSVTPALLRPETVIEPELDDSVAIGAWRRGHVETVPAKPTNAINFGLHNRDLPTLWAFDRLAVLAAEEAGPVSWDLFMNRVRAEGAHVGSLLRHRDLHKPSGHRAGIGFPKPGVKVESSVERFVAAAIGSNRRSDGPFFVFALAGLVGSTDSILPTEAGLAVLSDLVDTGLAPTLPQPPRAFDVWWRYLRVLAPVEHAAWRKVLRIVTDRPNRDELVEEFPEWRGHIATTNTVGFISRSREWGLVEPDLIDQRYRLTDLGATVAGEE